MSASPAPDALGTATALLVAEHRAREAAAEARAASRRAEDALDRLETLRRTYGLHAPEALRAMAPNVADVVARFGRDGKR